MDRGAWWATVHEVAESDTTATKQSIVVKNLPASAGDMRDTGSIPVSRRSPGGGHGNSLQFFCLEKPMDRGA